MTPDEQRALFGDSFDEMKIRAKHAKLNYPYLFEGDKTGISRKYGPTATPHAFVFDADRKLRYVGRIDDSERESYAKVNDLRNALDDPTFRLVVYGAGDFAPEIERAAAADPRIDFRGSAPTEER